jgi:hypothetical protein
LGGEFARPARVGIAGQRPRSERTRRVGDDRPDQAAALGAPVAPTTAMIFFSVIIYSCDLFSDTDPELPRRIEDLVSPRRDQGCVAAISIRRRNLPAFS